MKITPTNNSGKRISFSAIKLSQKEMAKSRELLSEYKKACIKKRPQIAFDLFKIFDPKIKEESLSYATKWRSKDDVLQDFYLEFFENIIYSLKERNPLNFLIKKMDKFKPSTKTFKTEFGDNSIDKKIKTTKNSNKEKTSFADKITKDFTAIYVSRGDIKQDLQRFYKEKENFDKILTEKELSVCDKYLEGHGYNKIAEDLKITATRVRSHVMVIIAKIKASHNLYDKDTSVLIEKISKRFSIKDTEIIKNLFTKNPTLSNLETEELMLRIGSLSKTLGIPATDTLKLSTNYSNLLSLKPETIKSNIQKSSEYLEIKEKDFIKICRKAGNLLYARPERLKQNVENMAKILKTDKRNILELAKYSSNILTTKDTTLVKRIKNLAKALKISENESLNLFKKSNQLFTRNTDSLVKNMKTTARLLNLDYETYIKLAKKQTNLIYQKPETIFNNVKQMSILFNVSTEDLVKSFNPRPQLFIQKPETIKENVDTLSKLFKLPFSECVKICLNAPQLFCQKPETIYSNAKNYALLSGMNLQDVIKKWKKQPNLFLYNPNSLVKKNNITDFYSVIRGEQNKTFSARFNNDKDLYCAILKYLMKKSGEKDIPSSRKTYETLKEFLLTHPDKEFSFELPAHSEYESFVEFSQNLSNELLGKNIFQFKLKKQ